MSALPPKADMCSATSDVRFWPKSGGRSFLNARSALVTDLRAFRGLCFHLDPALDEVGNVPALLIGQQVGFMREVWCRHIWQAVFGGPRPIFVAEPSLGCHCHWSTSIGQPPTRQSGSRPSRWS